MSNDQNSSEVTVSVQPHDTAAAIETVRTELVAHPLVRDYLGDGELTVVGVELLDKEPEAAGFQAWVHHRSSCRTVQVRGRVDDLGSVAVRPSAHRPLTTDEEYAAAVETVLRDPGIGELNEADELVTYRPMPPYADIQLPDGTVQRVVTVGLHTDRGEVAHRIVGVRVADGAVLRELAGLPHPSADNCEPTPPNQSCPVSSGRDQVRVRVQRGGTRLWDFIVVRPKASSGINGSGVELRFVDYRGTRVLYQAHVPILNVQYGAAGAAAGCGPTYRDWQNAEACFTAVGSEPVGPGWRLCSQAPQSILESGHDGGNFRGVALWYNEGDLRIVSQLQAGWYRYISDWHLRDDGTIGPRFGFAATANPCTCKVHTHHAYWRLDFDIVTADDNVVEEYNNPPIIPGTHWHTKRYEIRRPRDPGRQRRWRVRKRGTPIGYSIVPGPHDGTADAYGAGDVWVLRYHSGEIDDGHGFTTDPALSRADIDRFLTGEPVDGYDIVVWYGGHFVHDEAHPSPGGHIVGPDLTPVNWPRG